MRLTWDQVFAWRLRRQFVAPRAANVSEIAGRLCGVQAQVTSAAEMAVALRSSTPEAGALVGELNDGTLIKTWAMRGTLHALTPDLAAACLSLRRLKVQVAFRECDLGDGCGQCVSCQVDESHFEPTLQRLAVPVDDSARHDDLEGVRELRTSEIGHGLPVSADLLGNETLCHGDHFVASGVGVVLAEKARRWISAPRLCRDRPM